jgi:hypothetical protein
LSVQQLDLGGRPLELRLSPAARSRLAAGGAPLVAEMELYFSCLIRKRVRFPATPHVDASCVRVGETLTVCFRPVMTRACAIETVEGSPELEAFPIQRRDAFLPKWLQIDWRNGAWSGEFGF